MVAVGPAQCCIVQYRIASCGTVLYVMSRKRASAREYLASFAPFILVRGRIACADNETSGARTDERHDKQRRKNRDRAHILLYYLKLNSK